ncbi:hypothetical protein GPECTOR_165g162 [Gonium pectorale]|uniref:Uncharacterized protein n=1 Tax=Gonium pectorale TaxID=33097 RepID=A0A150FXG4_GONPE|nr:hypothetical protein GPECTOR_165g162 [Gonium pectorale]|eukprot:KXZ42302.1 hypothetical protein GPECTOR_165g162 [Gonium pectorale]
MGSALSSNARQVARSVAPQRKLKPFSTEEIDALNRMAEKEQARMKELPSMEELNAKDGTLGDLLNKLGGSIAGRDLTPEEPAEASTSGRGRQQMPPARPPQARLAAEAASWRTSFKSADEQPGRLPSYVLREILEARTAAASEGQELDLGPYISTFRADRAKLLSLLDSACLPLVGKVPVFGHQYAFARPPAWWLREGLSGAQFKSEPDALRERLMGNPVAPGGGGAGESAMFGGGRAQRRGAERATAREPEDARAGVEEGQGKAEGQAGFTGSAAGTGGGAAGEGGRQGDGAASGRSGVGQG